MHNGLSRCSVTIVAGVFALLMSGSPATAQTAATLKVQGAELDLHGDVNGAIEKYRQALALAPNDKIIRQNLAIDLNSAGVGLYNNKDYAGATAMFQEALSLVPSFRPAQDNLNHAQASKLTGEGIALYKNADFPGAIAKFKAALALVPDYKSAKVNCDAAEAEVMMRSDDFAGAVAKLQEATSLAPTNTMLQGKLAQAQTQLAAQQAAAEKDKK